MTLGEVVLLGTRTDVSVVRTDGVRQAHATTSPADAVKGLMRAAKVACKTLVRVGDAVGVIPWNDYRTDAPVLELIPQIEADALEGLVRQGIAGKVTPRGSRTYYVLYA